MKAFTAALQGALKGVWVFIRTSIIAVAVVATPVVAAVTAIGVLVFTSLPGPVPEAREVMVSTPTIILDAKGNLIGVLRAYDQALPTTPEDIGENIVEALVAAEDRRFFEHTGVDPIGVARAARTNLEEGETVQGGSTITQQLIKNRYLGGEQTLSRKIQEAVLAQRIEEEMTKEEILFEYLSSVYFGSGAYGLSSAAEVYFRKAAKDLTVSEAATIVGTLPSPTANSPHTSLENSEQARLLTLDLMEEVGYITAEEKISYAAEKLLPVDDFGSPLIEPQGPYTPVWPRPSSVYGPYPTFTTYVMDYLVNKYGEKAVFEGGLVVETTLDPDLQNAALDAANFAIQGADDPTVTAGIASVDPKNGFITSMADTGNWSETQVNYAAGGSTGYQPGSSFKPFVVLAAIEQGVSPDSSISYGGSYVTSTGEVLRNYGGEGGGTTTIRNATRVSLNVPFVILADRVGPNAVAEVANRAGIKRLAPEEQYGVSIALGAYEVSPLDMASAYATFANRGLYFAPTPVKKIVNPAGVTLEDNTVRSGEQVFDPAAIDILNGVLQGVVEGGTGTSARTNGRQVAGKTGTAENYTAAWFAGYTPNFAAAVWLGHSDGTKPLRIYGNGEIVGGGPPAGAWKRFADFAFGFLPPEGFVPAGPLPPPRGGPSGEGQPPQGAVPLEVTAAPEPPPKPVVLGGRGSMEKTQTPE